jgi:KDO2-lipid IV(A) lauroyltransferase
MTAPLYWIVRGLVAVIQALPLRLVAICGRLGGFVWWLIDFKHRSLALRNLQAAFPEKPMFELKRITRETFQRIGENSLTAIKTASLSSDKLDRITEVRGLEKFPAHAAPGAPKNCIAAIGHFGNFELYAVLARRVFGWRPATTYRGMNQPRLDAIIQKLRERSGCLFFERRTDANVLREALNKGGLILGLLADQHPNRGGVLAPFMGRMCATTTAPALFALRYDAPLFPVICYRVSLGRWRIEVDDPIPLTENGAARSVQAVTTDINKAFEAAIRRDPANWFWVHNRWKKPRIKSRKNGSAAPPADPGEEFVSP